MGGVTAAPTGARAQEAFPSVAWFEALSALMASQESHFAQLGDIDCTMQVTMLDGADGEPWHVQVRFEGLSVAEVRQVGDDDAGDADFVLETDVDTWREMVDSIVAGEGRPDLDHTLNRLSMPGTPIRVWGEDPLGRDAYFRFNQTLQHYVNNAWLLETTWPEQ